MFLCHDLEQIDSALDRFPFGAPVIIEPWLTYEHNLCVQFLIGTESIRFLGAAEQIIEDDTRHMGNILRRNQPVPEFIKNALRHACEISQSLGYRGVAGFDVLVADENTAWVIDANFRMNGSTVAMLLAATDSNAAATSVMESLKVPSDDLTQLTRLLKACEAGELKVIAASLDSDTGCVRLNILRACRALQDNAAADTDCLDQQPFTLAVA